MKTFRVLAAAYALLALLIAPAWLSADQDVVPPVELPATEAPAPDVAGTPAAPAAHDDRPPVAAAEDPAATPAENSRTDRAAKRGEEPDAGEPVATTAASGSVRISDYKFSPATITVSVGDTVTWTNDGPTVHTATAEDGSFDTGILNEGESGSATFDEAGTISYICTPHPNMRGKVVVQAASAQSDDGADEGDGSDPVATTAGSDSDGLPATGGETIAIALLGLATLGTGLLLRRGASA